MARKRKASESAPASNDASPLPPTSDTTSSKRPRPQIDWGSIDERGGFGGFTVKAVPEKRPGRPLGRMSLKKQKSDDGSQSADKDKSDDDSQSARKEGYKEASMGAEVRQKNPYPQTKLSDIHVTVEPQAEWESTARYRKFTINSEEFEVGQIVFVKKAEDANDSPNAIPQWFAKVLEVRAGDPSHVFLRVYWAYRPEDLPGGRQRHHGAAELIVSNHMDIIEAVTVESLATVIHWTDNPEDSAWPAKDQLFWRQSFDITKPKGKQLSPLPKYCVDRAPCNPDEPVIQCPACKDWLHARCLETAAVKTAAKRAAKASSARNHPTVSAKLSTSDPNKTRLTVTLQHPDNSRTYDVPVKCLICTAMIDDADNTTPADSDRGSSNPADEPDESDGIAVAMHPGPSAQTPTSTSKPPPESTDDDSTPERDRDRDRDSDSTADPQRSASPKRSGANPATPKQDDEADADASILQSGIKSVSRLLWRRK